MEDCELSKWQDRCLSREKNMNVQALDFALDELSLMCQIISRYIKFLDSNMDMVLDLYVRVQQLIGYYVSLEDTYCALNVGKAICIAQPTEIQTRVYVSTMVEDVAFILKKSIDRAISTQR